MSRATQYRPEHWGILRGFFVSVLLCLCSTALAQGSNSLDRDDEGWEALLDDWIDSMSDDDAEAEQVPDRDILYETLVHFSKNRININQASVADLMETQILSERQATEICNYIGRYGAMRSEAELMLISSLGYSERLLLGHLVQFGEPVSTTNYVIPLRHLFQTTSNEVVTSAQIPFYKRLGFTDGSYHGSPVRHWLRASFATSNQMRFGFTAAQDAGEPFLKTPNQLRYDYYSFYFMLRKRGWLKSLVLGRYRAKLGAGLILNTNLSLGKQFLLSQQNGNMPQLRVHASRSDGNYLQGAAATVGLLRNVDLTLLASWREIDATLNTQGDGISTILTSGLHRTDSELARKGNASQTLGGANVRWKQGRWALGLSGVGIHYSLPLTPVKRNKDGRVPDSQVYREVFPHGSDFMLLSTDYSFFNHSITVSGETAMDGQGHLATVNALTWDASRTFSLNAIQRHYAMGFQSPLGRAFSEGGVVRNESGVYVGIDWETQVFNVKAYTDVAYFQWPRYLAFGSSWAFDNMLQLTRQLHNADLTMRYRLHMRQRDGFGRGNLMMKSDHRMRLALAWKHGQWQTKSQLDASYCRYKGESLGAMLSQTVALDMKKGKISGGMGYFHTKDNDSRISFYEPSTLYNMSFPSLFGRGIHGFALAQYNLVKRLSLAMKYSGTVYFDRKQIGSAKQLVNQNYLTDLEIMVKLKF